MTVVIPTQISLKQKGAGSVEYTPIKALNTFSTDWKIKGRIVSKTDKKITSKSLSLLKITLIDKDDSLIDATFFNEAADFFDCQIQDKKVYLFSNGNVKIANKKFTSTKNDFCIVFEKNASIVPVDDDGSIAA